MIVGIMMSFATNSRPASGSEHHLSHFFEITGIVKNEPYFAHGIDVFYSTYVTAQIRENLLKISYPKAQFIPNRQDYERDINEAYGVVGKGCIALQDKLGTYEKDRGSVYNSCENEIKEVLSEMPTSAEIKSMLDMVELDLNDFYKFYGEDKIKTAIKYAKDLKDRYTVLWMNYDILGETL
jgi:glycerol-1-phosphate dehydrogenase [NAD(P)+]